MSIFQRIATIFGAKANKALDKAENPNETLDYSYQKRSNCRRRCAAALPTSRPAASASNCRSTSSSGAQNKLSGQAQKAMEIGREDLAREALTRQVRAEPADHRSPDPA